MDRNLISYDKDIYKEVSELSGGKFTVKQVQLLWESVVSYIYFLIRYTPIVRIHLRFLGDVYANVREMKSRLNYLNRMKKENRKLTEKQEIEYGVLTEKIKTLQKEQSGGKLKRGNYYMLNLKSRAKYYRHGYRFEQIEDFQYTKFK